MPFFKSSKTYRFHLRSGQAIKVRGVKEIQLGLAPDGSYDSYEITFVSAKHKFISMAIKDIVAVVET